MSKRRYQINCIIEYKSERMMCISSSATLAIFAHVHKIDGKLLTALDGLIARPNNFLKSHDGDDELFVDIKVLGDASEVFADE
ncbi:hypothetical protein DCC85_14345 [Paenibacillus sp. CAA11]|uniref:hypothetical protein n=1 Tax=Paenibacillus sp. CAA11 TaxID=1532905 RepID=UPI000D3C6EEB|nr:hypothetical protein [Paenibacillus sp. CAA11]AWB45289.1 hypothetical protein DCC85_14345 [Paenibacillus sp. CAA11]